MLRHGWKPIALLAAGVLLALGAGSLRPETPAAAQDVQAELADLLVTDGLTRAELVGLYPALAGVPFQPPACVAGAEMFQSKGA